MEKKLEVKNLRISFKTANGKVQAVRNINFDLHKGETLAIVGESGSGKSVTSKSILGILAANAIIESGEIIYDGKDLLKITENDFYRIRGDKIAMIFQDPMSSLNPIMRIGKQLTEAMILKGKARQKASKLAFNSTLDLLKVRLVEAIAQGGYTQHDVIEGQATHQTTDGHKLDPVIEDADQGRTAEAVIPVGHGIEQGFTQGFRGVVPLVNAIQTFELGTGSVELVDVGVGILKLCQ